MPMNIFKIYFSLKIKNRIQQNEIKAKSYNWLNFKIILIPWEYNHGGNTKTKNIFLEIHDTWK